jgi:cobalamin biosynthesis Mg chelatase CobN
MRGAPRRSARSSFLLPLALALLALVALPNFASAGEVPQYETESTESFKVPNTEKNSAKPKHSSTESSGTTSNLPAKASETGNGGEKSSSQEEPEESSENEKSQTGGAASAGGGNGGGGESSKSGGHGGQTNDGVGGAEALTGGGTATPVAHKTETSSGGGSSPVVPILIAVIVLAAISIGVVLYRQRKSGGQGPDRSVSSPNAS